MFVFSLCCPTDSIDKKPEFYRDIRYKKRTAVHSTQRFCFIQQVIVNCEPNHIRTPTFAYVCDSVSCCWFSLISFFVLFCFSLAHRVLLLLVVQSTLRFFRFSRFGRLPCSICRSLGVSVNPDEYHRLHTYLSYDWLISVNADVVRCCCSRPFVVLFGCCVFVFAYWYRWARDGVLNAFVILIRYVCM